MFYPSQARPVICEDDYRAIIEMAASKSRESAENFMRAVSHFVITSRKPSQSKTVALGSCVSFMDVATGIIKTVELVGPDEVDVERSKISVLSPLGLALLGLAPRELIQWQISPNVRRTLEIVLIKSGPALCATTVDNTAGCPPLDQPANRASQ